jgi:hypothetical protein
MKMEKERLLKCHAYGDMLKHLNEVEHTNSLYAGWESLIYSYRMTTAREKEDRR